MRPDMITDTEVEISTEECCEEEEEEMGSPAEEPEPEPDHERIRKRKGEVCRREQLFACLKWKHVAAVLFSQLSGQDL